MLGNQKMDGGQVALIGFLYQIVGTLSLQARAECPNGAVENADIDALFGVNYEIYHERRDVDALIRLLGLDKPDAYILIQFKYSQKPEEAPVTPSALAEIIKGFCRGMQQWQQDQQRITTFRLITNRPMSPTLRPLMVKLPGQRTHKLFQDPEVYTILQKTEIIEKYDFAPCIASLKHFADEYGTDEEEFERGMHSLIGELVERASKRQAPPLRECDMLRAFRGYGHLRKLTIATIREYTSGHWETLMENLGLQEMPIRRRLFEEAQNKLNEHAFIVFYGPGGSGKSVLTWHLLRTRLEGTNEFTGSPTAFLPARRIQPHTLSWVVGEWVGIPEDKRTEQMDQVLRRIRIANPTAHPIFYLGLDGLDEESETESRETSIREIVEWFWQKEKALRKQQESGSIKPPDATLIITCREPQTIIDNWLDGALSSTMRANDENYIPISEYSPEELLDAVEQVMLPHVERFKQALVPQLQPLFPSDTLFPGSASIEVPPVHKEVLDALYQPAMWYALRNISVDKQTFLLDGNKQILNLLAKHFLFWFSTKAQKRWNWKRREIKEVLEEVAVLALKTNAAQFSYIIWKEVGQQGYTLEGRQVYQHLYREALSAGVIREVEPRKIWNWRHPFVGFYLAGISGEEEWDNGRA